MRPSGYEPLPTKLERIPTVRSSWEKVRPNQKVEVKENRQMGWRASTGPLTWDQRGGSQGEASGQQCGTIDGSNSWNAAILSCWG